MSRSRWRTGGAQRFLGGTGAICILAIGLVLAVLTWQLTERRVESMVQAAAIRDARAWAGRGAALLGEIRSGPAASPQFGRAAAGPADGRTYRLQLFDGGGRLLLDSGAEPDPSGAGVVPAAAQAAQGRAVSVIRRDTGPGGLSARTYVPLVSVDRVDGVLGIHTDEANRAARLRGALAAWVLPILAAVFGLVLSGAGLFLRVDRLRQRRREADLQAQLADVRREVERAAATDPLTGLASRHRLAAAFGERRELLRERDLMITLLLIEVDRLAQVGDVEGPERRDSLLAGLARVVRSTLREEDIAGRLDDGRFLLVLSAPRYQRPGEAVARRLQETAAAEPELRCLGEPVSLSIGVTRVTRAETTFSQAVVQAELSLRAARADGGGTVAGYRPALGRARERHNGVLRRVTEALESGRIGPLYQPIIALDDRRIVGFEALARLGEPDGTLVEAASLRPAITDGHLSTRISERILAQAIRDSARLRRQGLEFGRIAVNATERQLADPDFAERVLDQLMLEGLSPHDLSLELSEHLLLSRREARILKTLESLAAAGVELAFDDFGTGYAALSHLRRFPVGILKLESSFVNEIAADPAVRAISTAVIEMAHALERKVVAEGVETAEVDAILRDLGCDRAQGFHYCPPVPVGEVERLARSGLAA